MKIFFFISILLVFPRLTSSDLDKLEKHFEAHRQSDWQYIKSATALGEWHSAHGDFLVDYYLKSHDKIAIIGTEKKVSRIGNGLAAWEAGEWTENKATALQINETLGLNQVWYFGSPLWDIRDKLVENDDVKIDDFECTWYSFLTNKLRYDYFIRKKDQLLYSVSITDLEGVQLLTRKVEQYRKFGPFYLPSQVRITTTEGSDLYVFTNYLLGEAVKDNWFIYPQ
jgi:hypothetical protein